MRMQKLGLSFWDACFQSVASLSVTVGSAKFLNQVSIQHVSADVDDVGGRTIVSMFLVSMFSGPAVRQMKSIYQRPVICEDPTIDPALGCHGWLAIPSQKSQI